MRVIPAPSSVHGDGRFVVGRSGFVPAYLRRPELVRARAEEALDLLTPCRVCPRPCREVDRRNDKLGACRIGRYARVASAFPHFGEEDVLRGWRGSGTIFFGGCNLRCVFCQNHDISQAPAGRELKPEQLAARMIRLQDEGCHNINFVTPEHVVPQILEALPIAIDAGLRLPIVYNTSSYDSADSIRLMDGIVDVYMPDFKLWDDDASYRLLGARNYRDVARTVVTAMHEQVGNLVVDEEGLALRGLLVRHLVMPNLLEDTREIFSFVASLATDTYVNVMDQYRPDAKVPGEERYAAIDRPVTSSEMRRALRHAEDAGLWRIDTRWRRHRRAGRT